MRREAPVVSYSRKCTWDCAEVAWRGALAERMVAKREEQSAVRLHGRELLTWVASVQDGRHTMSSINRLELREMAHRCQPANIAYAVYSPSPHAKQQRMHAST